MPPTREEMIAAIKKARDSQKTTPSREEMIATIKKTRDSKYKNMSGVERTWAKGEDLLQKGLTKVAPILEPISKVSEAITKPVIEGYKKTPIGGLIDKGTEYISENILGGKSVSDVIPGAFNDTGAGFRLKKGGMFDPTYKETSDTVRDAVLDPMNIAIPAAGEGLKLIKPAIKAGAKKAAVGLSGLPKEVIETYMTKAPEVNKMIAEGIDGLPKKVHQSVKETVRGVTDKKGMEISDAIKNAGGSIDISVVRSPIDEAIKKAKEVYKAYPSSVNKESFETLIQIRDQYFPKGVKQVSPEIAFDLQQKIKPLMRLSDKDQITGKLSGLPKDKQQIVKSANDIYATLNEQFENVTGGISKDLKGSYKKYMELQDDMDRIIGDPEKTYRTLRTSNNQAKGNIKSKLKEIDTEFGTDLSNQADLMQTYSYLENPSITPLSSQGATSTSKSLTAKGIGGAIGAGLGSAFGAPVWGGIAGAAVGDVLASPASIKRYMDLVNSYRALKSKIPFSTPNIPSVAPVPLYRLGAELGDNNESN